jgi:predicted phosphodiesterase
VPVYNPVSAMVKKPYLVWQLDDTSMRVKWQLSYTRSSTLSWGISTSYSSGSVTTTESGSHLHSYDITGLTPGTKYYYKVEEDGLYTGSFYAPDSTNSSIKLFALGDSQGAPPPKHYSDICRKIYDITSSGTTPNLLFHLGDWTDNDTDEEWNNGVFNVDYIYLNKLKANLPFMGVRGNHDIIDDAGVNYELFWDYNYYNPCYYTFDYGPTSNYVLDMYATNTSGSTQYNWFVNTVTGSAQPWRIVWVHTPMYSDDGGHGSNTDFRSIYEPLFRAYSVDLVVAGHNHYYARCSVSGVTHVTAGGAGESLYTITNSGIGLVTSSQNYHFLEFNITETTLNCIAKKWDDLTELDNFSLIKGSFSNTYSTLFAGTDDYGIANHDDSLNFGRNNFGISFWMKANSGGTGFQALISKINDLYSSSGGAGWAIYLNSSGRLSIAVQDTNNGDPPEYTFSDTNYRDDLWHHVVWNYNFSTGVCSYYVDGVALTSDTGTTFAGNFDTTYPLMVGMGYNKGAAKDLPFNGLLDEISIHNEPLSSETITDMYNEGVPTDLSGDGTLIAWWRMGDSDTFPAITDRVGSNDLTLTNMTSGAISSDVPA